MGNVAYKTVERGGGQSEGVEESHYATSRTLSSSQPATVSDGEYSIVHD